MPTLTASTVLVNPESGDFELLSEGSELPDWATGLVGDHLLADPESEPEAAKPAPRGRAKAQG